MVVLLAARMQLYDWLTDTKYTPIFLFTERYANIEKNCIYICYKTFLFKNVSTILRSLYIKPTKNLK